MSLRSAIAFAFLIVQLGGCITSANQAAIDEMERRHAESTTATGGGGGGM
jgi:hypothetical protein